MNIASRIALLSLVGLSFALSQVSDSAAQSLTVDGVLSKGAGYTVYLVETAGKSTAAVASSSGKFSFKKVTKARL